jgi:ABC-type branched-subunit amino acid transport system substrate-binding protein
MPVFLLRLTLVASLIGRTQAAYYRMINDAGGVNGRKIDFITLDHC